MNIRKIIREEVDEFEWAGDIPDARADYLFGQLSDEERVGPYSIKKALMSRLGVTEKEAMDVVAKHHQPKEKFKHEYDEDTTYWTTDNASSTFKFKYPPKWNSLTRKFVDWVRWHPGTTKREFYKEVLGRPYTSGHQAQFFSSIQDAGIVKTTKGRNGEYTYTIGPNYESWTNGKLNRYMGMNIPLRQA
jgi:hypothetical protein